MLLFAVAGCQHAAMFYQSPNGPEMLGTKVDQLNQAQEENAEASKYVVYQHEFKLNVRDEEGRVYPGVRLNEFGEDHVKRIAENIRRGAPYPVVIERNRTSVKEGTEYKYPVHFDPELDMRRREVVVRALNKMGIPDADTRVVVAPAFAEPLTAMEAQMSYGRGIRNFGGGMGGGGGFGGGFGGGGFGGGFQ
jgi:hypothetical protein